MSNEPKPQGDSQKDSLDGGKINQDDSKAESNTNDKLRTTPARAISVLTESGEGQKPTGVPGKLTTETGSNSPVEMKHDIIDTPKKVPKLLLPDVNEEKVNIKEGPIPGLIDAQRVACYIELSEIVNTLDEFPEFKDNEMAEKFRVLYLRISNEFPAHYDDPFEVDVALRAAKANARVKINYKCCSSDQYVSFYVPWFESLGVKTKKEASDKRAKLTETMNQEIVKSAADSVALMGTCISLIFSNLIKAHLGLIILVLILASVNIFIKGYIQSINILEDTWNVIDRFLQIYIYVFQVMAGLYLAILVKQQTETSS